MMKIKNRVHEMFLISLFAHPIRPKIPYKHVTPGRDKITSKL